MDQIDSTLNWAEPFVHEGQWHRFFSVMLVTTARAQSDLRQSLNQPDTNCGGINALMGDKIFPRSGSMIRMEARPLGFLRHRQVHRCAVTRAS